jgi:lysophospholipase L1-like esterase
MKAGFTRIFAGALVLAACSLLSCSSDSSPAHSGSGGSTGGEVTGSGGASTGGTTTSPTGSGGALPSGGMPASGGQSQAGSVSRGGSATGGTATNAGGQPAVGGSASGGSASGGAAGGASATGGNAAGGSKAGGSLAGGSVAGGSAKGGSVAGGSATGGRVAGGATITGGVSTGGTGSGGKTATGGSAGTGAGGAIVIPATGTYPVSSGTPTVYLAGDSTVSTYATNPSNQQGWGQRLQEFFTSDVIVVNKAIGGESSKSFADQGHLAEIVALLQPGDYLFAQWGINDRSVAGPDRATDPATTFRTYLKQYIDGARGKNAIPVLITPTPRHQYSGGVFQNGFPEYCTAIKAVGTETNTPVIDLQSEGLAYYTSIGEAKVTSTIILNGTDALHFNAEGADQMARLVALGVQALNFPISQFVIQAKLDGG